MHRHDIQFPSKDAALREDVHALGALVGEVLREQGGEQLFELVEGDRLAAISRREGEAEGAIELTIRAQDRPPAVARDLARAFSTWFEVVNLAEQIHRIRRRRQYFLKDSAPQPFGVADGIQQLKRQGLSLTEAVELIRSLRIEPVFTAHPTESTRRTMLRKQQRIAQLMFSRLDPSLTPREVASVWRQIRTEITIGWQTEDHPRHRLTVADEREQALFFLAEVIYRIVPAFYEEIEGALESVYGAAPGSIELPNLLDFGSWVGGDMDGNPDVHAKTIRETLARHQQLIVSTYYGEALALASKLSQSASRVRVPPELQKRIDTNNAVLPGAQQITPARHDRMPYRVFLGQVAERLRNTYDGKPNRYDNAAQLIADLELVAESLKANRGVNAGWHSVRRFLRRVRTFGFHLATLDVRQHTDVHHAVLAQGFADEEWPRRPAAERLARLRLALERDQGPSTQLDAVGRRTLAVFQAMVQCRNKYGPLAIGDYVVSATEGPDDVLAALLLARWAEVIDKRSGEVAIDFAPLFETAGALGRCGEVMHSLLIEPSYQRHLAARGRGQVVLIGYATTNKLGGIAGARWATHQAQAELVRALDASHVELTVFHSRGGSIGRGGGRIDTLVRSAPPGAVHGRLLVTEQGETVNQSYGLRPVAMRTFERAFHALALATNASRRGAVAEERRYLEAMHTLAESSRAAYRRLLFGGPEAYRYFRQATPIDVIERMQIGSRPVARSDAESVEHLRSVPWVFAWAQSRHMLPGWFGMGAGLETALHEHGVELLREMRTRWFFFGALLDDVEAMLARTDLEIAASYDGLAEESLRSFLPAVRADFALATRFVLEIKQSSELLDSDPTLKRAIKLRNPYIDPMHLMQVDLLKRWRRGGRRDNAILEALLASISGISQGLQSTG